MLEPKKDSFWKLFLILCLLVGAFFVHYILRENIFVTQGSVLFQSFPAPQDNTPVLRIPEPSPESSPSKPGILDHL